MEDIVGEPSTGLDIEDMAVFQKTTKGNRPTKILGGEGMLQRHRDTVQMELTWVNWG